MNGALGHFFALSRLNWAGDNLPNSALIVQKSGLKHRSSIHPKSFAIIMEDANCKSKMVFSNQFQRNISIMPGKMPN